MIAPDWFALIPNPAPSADAKPPNNLPFSKLVTTFSCDNTLANLPCVCSPAPGANVVIASW